MTATAPSEGIKIINDSGATIPARSIVVVTSLEVLPATSLNEATTRFHVTQYSIAQAGPILVTGPSYIRPGKQGRAFLDQMIYVAIDTGIATPLIGEQWGPVPGKWFVSRGGMGFFCCGYSDPGDAYKRAMFIRGNGWAHGKLAASLTAGTAAIPSACLVDTWHPDPAGTGKLVKALQANLLGLTVTDYSKRVGSLDYGCTFVREGATLVFTDVSCEAT